MAKKSRRARRREKKKGRLAPAALMAQARQRLDRDDAREALDLLREAQHKDARHEGLAALLFCAYRVRARQLVLKEMPKEAEVMRSRAADCRAQVDLQALPDVDLVRFIAALPVLDAGRAYADALSMRGALPDVERRLADRAVVERALETLSALPEGHVLREDAPIVATGVESMEKGEWIRAADLLSEVRRRSPFAPWRVFCRGMACFCDGDDAGARRAAGMIPDDFVLAEVAAGWAPSPETPEAVRALLWEGCTDNTEALARTFVKAVQNARTRNLERLIPRLAQALYPENPKAMGASLIEALGIAVGKEDLQMSDVQYLAHRLLGKGRAPLVIGKVGLVAQAVTKRIFHVTPAQTYLSHIELEFPDRTRQALARGRVLEHLARVAHRNGSHAFFSLDQRLEIAALIGHPVADMVDVELMLASLEADPDNREGYAFLLDILPSGRAARQRAEGALEEMIRRFPEDPAPCLELANLYYAKNAYRKAEGVLVEAQRRAPHDERVLDRLAIGHLKAAEQSRNRGHRRLAERDFEATDALGRRRVASMLTVKRWGLEVIDRGLEALPEIERALSERPPAEQLRLLVLLMCDLGLTGKQPEAQEKLMEMLYDRDGLVNALTSSEAAALLAPIDPTFELIFEDLDVAPILSDFWPVLFLRIEGEDVFAALEALLECGAQEAARREIDRRLKTAAGEKQDVTMLLFYLAVIRYMENLDLGSRRFVEVLDRADAAQRRRLQAAALRLSAFADGPLHEALRRFEFDELGVEFSSPFPDMELPYNDEEDWDDDDDDDEWDDEAFDALNPIAMVESMIDEQGLRGASIPALREAVGILRATREGRSLLDSMAQLLEPLSHMLSREANALLFSKRRK